jgi:hypothetical protein
MIMTSQQISSNDVNSVGKKQLELPFPHWLSLPNIVILVWFVILVRVICDLIKIL